MNILSRDDDGFKAENEKNRQSEQSRQTDQTVKNSARSGRRRQKAFRVAYARHVTLETAGPDLYRVSAYGYSVTCTRDELLGFTIPRYRLYDYSRVWIRMRRSQWYLRACALLGIQNDEGAENDD